MPRERQWHVAENPGHGCCFSVGIQDAEDNIVADVVYREDGPLVVAAPDLYAALHELREAWCLNACDAASPDEGMNHLPECEKARAALAKAEGRDAA